MSKRAYVTVVRSFQEEAERAFGFLASQLGLSGPSWSDLVAPAVVYAGRGHRYRVLLDTREMTVVTQAELDLDGARLVARLDQLVAAAGLRSQGRVMRGARTLHELRNTLESQAGFVRLLHPLLTAAEAPDLLSRAGARRLRLEPREAPGPLPS
jgi:hypothetical protein